MTRPDRARSNVPLLAIALGALLVLGAAVGWRLLSEDGAERSAVRGGAAAAPDPGAERLARPEAEPEAPAAAAPGDDAPAADAPGAERRSLATAADAGTDEDVLRLAGRVVLPPETPRDESTEVVALRQPTRYPPPSWLDWSGDGEDAWTDPLLARAPVAPDGSFVLEVPFPVDQRSDDSRLWLDLEASYVYLAASVFVRTGDPPPSLELAPALGGRVTGRVRLAAGLDPAALDGAQVTLHPGLDELSLLGNDMLVQVQQRRTTVRLDDGAAVFELGGVRPGKRHRLQIDPATYAPALSEPLRVDPGLTSEVTLDVPRGAGVAGRVVDEEGAGVPEAEVAVRIERAESTDMPWMPAPRLERKAATDAEGRFLLRGVPLGTGELRASAEGRAGPAERELEVAGDLDDVEIVLASGRILRGTVRWPDGSPAAGATVVASGQGRTEERGTRRVTFPGETETAQADDDGAFELAGLAPTGYEITATAEREDGLRQGRVERTGTPGEPLELVLEEQPVVVGHVRDAAGEPVTSFTLTVESGTSGRRDRSFARKDGRFALSDLEPGTWELVARGKGFAPSDPLAFQFPDAIAEPLEIVLSPGASVAGTVVGPDGRPIAGAAVGRAAAEGELPWTGGTSTERTTSDGAGRFELSELPAGPFALEAKAKGFAPSVELALDLVAGDAVPDVVLTLRVGGDLAGRVFEKSGGPAAHRMVSLMRAGFAEPQATTCDADGGFAFHGLEAGTWQVMALPADMDGDDQEDFLSNMLMTKVEIVEGETAWVELGNAPVDPVHVTGTVTAAGEPVEATISFVPESENVLGELSLARSEADGRFSVQLKKPGPYLVSVQGGGGEARFTLVVPAAEEHTIDLVLPVGRIEGRVLGPDGSPARGVGLTVRPEGPSDLLSPFGSGSNATTDDEGRYRFERLEAGTYAIAVGSASFGREAGPHGRSVRGGLELEEGGVLTGVDFRLEEPGEIRGRVLDPAGRPAAGAAVFVRDAAGLPLETLTSVVSGSDGSFRIRALAPGRYTLHARTADAVSAESAAVSVASDDAAELSLALQPGAFLLVTSKDESGEPVPIRVSVTDDEGRTVSGFASQAAAMEGFFAGVSLTEQRVGPLVPGIYAVRTVDGTGKEKRRKVRLEAGEERRLTERFRD